MKAKRKTMCPDCKKEIESVRVYSQCYQNAVVQGNRIVHYDSVEEVLETLDIECDRCGCSVKDIIKEN